MTKMKVIVWLVQVAVLLLAGQVKGFNLSPKPNLVLNDPQLPTELPKVHASYFGFALNLRASGLIVGAPRAQSTLEAQRKVNETGAIYRCKLLDGTCAPYLVDVNGNRIVEYSEYSYDSEQRDNQWLGAVIDGGIHDTDKLVICAPRYITPTFNEYCMHGQCYWVNDTLTEQPSRVMKISPLRLKTDQVIRDDKNNTYNNYIYGEEGLSAHITDNNEQILLGAPGINTWRGSMVRHKGNRVSDNQQISRRDLEKHRSPRQVPGDIVYQSEVLTPALWDQPEDSYFGYSVGSGYFDSNDKTKLLYVASAPKVRQQSGEAYVFEITGKSIHKYYTFRGEQFGEYFGYAVLTEDLNNDGLTDLIVSAPFHANGDFFDAGAIYVFLNLGRFLFEAKKLVSPVAGAGRFGTTLSRLGDINHDGFNDVAVGAPFAGNGSVFIYLGGPKGLRSQPSQHLTPPKDVKLPFGGTLMFGHGLSKGADFDKNGFNDFAIGAPNAEKVFFYRSYPVIKVIATLRSQSREIKPEQTKFQLTACYGITTSSKKVQNQEMAFRLVVDPQVKRVKFSDTQSNEMRFNAVAGLTQQCRVLDCDVRYSIADIFKPIELEMHYDVIHKVPDSEKFCEACVAVDPADPTVYSEKIIFSTGCATEICIADLEVKSSNLEQAFVLGSRRTFAVTYIISNTGETAYLPTINITSSNRLPFARIPSNCRLQGEVFLECDLNRGQPMAKGKTDSIDVIFDVSGVTGNSMILKAEVSSTGKEKTPANNIVQDVITLKEFTQIDAIGHPTTPSISLEENKDSTNIGNAYEIKSNGPSVVDTLEVSFYIPVAYRISGTSKLIQIVNTSNITMQAVYDTQIVGIEFYENNTQLLMNTYEFSSKSSLLSLSTSSQKSQNGLNYDYVKMGHVNEMTHNEILTSDSVLSAGMSSRARKRREAENNTPSKSEYARIVEGRSYELLADDMKSKLKPNKTIVFNCNDPERTVCVRAVLKVYHFKPEQPITVSMKYHVDLKEVNELLFDPWEFFVILIGLNVTKIGGNTDSELALVRKIEYNIISKHTIKSVPIWIIILAILGGLLILGAIVYTMYKLNFFKRIQKEEMDRLVQGTVSNPDIEPEAETLNSGNNN